MVFQTIISFDPFCGKSKKQAKLIAIYFNQIWPPLFNSNFPPTSPYFFCNVIATEVGSEQSDPFWRLARVIDLAWSHGLALSFKLPSQTLKKKLLCLVLALCQESFVCVHLNVQSDFRVFCVSLGSDLFHSVIFHLNPK